MTEKPFSPFCNWEISGNHNKTLILRTNSNSRDPDPLFMTGTLNNEMALSIKRPTLKSLLNSSYIIKNKYGRKFVEYILENRMMRDTYNVVLGQRMF